MNSHTEKTTLSLTIGTLAEAAAVNLETVRFLSAQGADA